MNNAATTRDIKELPYIVASNGLIVEISDAFAHMTEFRLEDLVNKNIEELFRTLRVGPDVSYEHIDEKVDCFLFTKSFEARFVDIYSMEEAYGKVYVFSEKVNSRLDTRLPLIEALCSHNVLGIAVYSMPDITLLNANQIWLNFLDKPFNNRENSIGKRISEFIPGWSGSTSEDIWRNVLLTQKPFYNDEYMFEFERGVTYWQASLTPVFEDGILKYCIEITTDITEKVLNRKKIEEQAKTIEQQKRELEIVLDNMSDGFSIVDKDGNYISINKTVKQWLKDIHSNKVGDTLSTIKYYDMQGKELTKEELPTYRIAKGESLESYEFLMKGDGYESYYSVNGAPIFDENGKYVKGVVNTRDITDIILSRKKLQDQMEEIEFKNSQLKQQKDELKAIIENVSDGLLLFNVDGSVKFINEEAKKVIYNHELYNKLGDSYKDTEYFDMNGKPVALNELPSVRAMKGEKVKNCFLVVKRPDKTVYYSVSGSPIYDTKGNVVAGLLCAHDITEFFTSQKQMLEQKKLLEVLANNIPGNLVVRDAEGKYLFFKNGIFDEIGPKFMDIQEFAKAIKNVDSYGNELPLEQRPSYRMMNKEILKDELFITRTGTKEYYTLINARPIYDEDGTFLYGINHTRDITELMRSQKALREIQDKLLITEREKNEALEKAMAVKDDFLSLISHEFRTPLNVINAAIQAMNFICGNELPEKVQKYIKLIRQNTFRQMRLVNNLLDITRIDAGSIKIHKKNIDIVFLTSSIVKSVHAYASQKDIEVTFKSSIAEKIISIDDEKYERIILNLLSNAIKFTPMGKLISVKLSTIKNKICVVVKDNGIGIPEDKIDMIFDRFGQVDSSLSRQAEGAGIGLSLVKRFVEALGGSISVKSKVGKGSTITVMLPDENTLEEQDAEAAVDLMDNRLVQNTTVEFSDIYL